ncbi:hypothetical protein [Anaerofustis sp. NSJ-163]|nr:hypothetical protein [Anaerofustis sp. NSJ-163]MCO8192976.1 hypothetical protein [Anaerofustis sp. NSJ-163]
MENNAKGASLIKVSSIIMIILSAFSFIFALLGLFGIIALDFLTIILIIWTFIYPAVMMATAVTGLVHNKSTDKKIMDSCFKWGIALIIIMILDYIIGFFLNGLYGVSIISLIRFIFPILYLVGVNQNKKSIDSNDFNN